MKIAWIMLALAADLSPIEGAVLSASNGQQEYPARVYKGRAQWKHTAHSIHS